MAEKGAFRIEELASATGYQQIPELTHSISVSSQKAIDEALTVLKAHKDSWVTLEVTERVAILEEITRGMMKVADRWVAASLEAKGMLANQIAEAEEWVLFATVVRALQLLRKSLIDIQKYGRPRISGRVTTRQDGQVVAQVFPRNRIESILFRRVTGEVWMEPGVTVEETTKMQALHYRYRNHKGKIALVLGAGNASFLPVIDCLHKLFIEDQVVVLKLNPVNAYLGPLI